MGIQERRAREREEMRHRILNAARDLFVEKGVEAVTMREIANQIEYSPTAIYVHFKDKMTLLQELCFEDFLAFGAAFSQVDRPSDPIEHLRNLGLQYVRFALEYPNHFRFMFMTPFPADAQPSEKSLAFKGRPDQDAYALLRNTVKEAIQAGRLRREWNDPDLVAQMLWSSAHGVCSLFIAKGTDSWIPWRDVQEVAASLIDASLRGLLKEPLNG